MAAQEFQVVSGDTQWLTSANHPSKVAIVASWTPTPVMSRSLSQYLFELEEIGFPSLVVNASGLGEDLVWPHGKPNSTVIATRPNVGYDFGSWADALDHFPGIRGFDEVLLTNDSMVGPFEPLTEISEAMEDSGADLFALTENQQHGRHMQSFFVNFRGGILEERPWRNFFADVQQKASKDDIVQTYELGLTRTAQRYGYSWSVMFTTEVLEGGGGNPTFERWRLLLDRGVPMVKRSLVTHPQYPATMAEIEAAVQARFGESLRDWMPEDLRIDQPEGGVTDE